MYSVISFCFSLHVYTCTCTLQLLTTEDWHNVFYSYIGPYRRWNPWIAALVAFYYGAVIVIGSCITKVTCSYMYMYAHTLVCVHVCVSLCVHVHVRLFAFL